MDRIRVAEHDDRGAIVSPEGANPDLLAESFAGDSLDGIDGADCAGSGGNQGSDRATAVHFPRRRFAFYQRTSQRQKLVLPRHKMIAQRLYLFSS